MANQMRNALDKAREYYIQKLLELGVYKHSDHQLYHLTLTEMADLYKKWNKQ
jgi:hypothetical protein